MTDWKARCAALINKIDYTWGDIPDDVLALIDRTRAELAQPEPQESAVAVAWCRSDDFNDAARKKQSFSGWRDQHPDCDLALYVSPVTTQPDPQGPTDEELPPRVGHILRLAEIIREVDGNHKLGAAALAEAILSHSGSRWTPAIEPVPVSQRLPAPEDCDAEGRCWAVPKYLPNGVEWTKAKTTNRKHFTTFYRHWLPHHALPVPKQEPLAPDSPYIFDTSTKE